MEFYVHSFEINEIHMCVHTSKYTLVTLKQMDTKKRGLGERSLFSICSIESGGSTLSIGGLWHLNKCVWDKKPCVLLIPLNHQPW